MAAPGDLSDADCAQPILSLSPPPCFTPCKLSQGHPWTVTSEHVQIVFRKILFSPSWEPATAEGWGGWEGCGGGSHSVLNSALQGRGEVGRCILSTGRPGAEALPPQGDTWAARADPIPCDLRRWHRGWPCELRSGKTTTVKPDNHLEGELRADGSTSHLLGACPPQAQTGKLYQDPSNQ